MTKLRPLSFIIDSKSWHQSDTCIKKINHNIKNVVKILFVKTLTIYTCTLKKKKIQIRNISLLTDELWFGNQSYFYHLLFPTRHNLQSWRVEHFWWIWCHNFPQLYVIFKKTKVHFLMKQNSCFLPTFHWCLIKKFIKCSFVNFVISWFVVGSIVHRRKERGQGPFSTLLKFQIN